MLPRIRRRDDLAHARLIKSLESLVSLQVFQVRPDSSITPKLLGLFRRDEPGLSERGYPPLRHRKSLPLRKPLPQIREIRERLHHLHAPLTFQLLLERIEVKLTFQMMHASLQKRLAVQATP